MALRRKWPCPATSLRSEEGFAFRTFGPGSQEGFRPSGPSMRLIIIFTGHSAWARFARKKGFALSGLRPGHLASLGGRLRLPPGPSAQTRFARKKGFALARFARNSFSKVSGPTASPFREGFAFRRAFGPGSLRSQEGLHPSGPSARNSSLRSPSAAHLRNFNSPKRDSLRSSPKF